MSNMSYCRFENTANDFRDCLEAAQDMENNAGAYEHHEDDESGETFATMSTHEQRGYRRLLEMSKTFLEMHNAQVGNYDLPEGGCDD